MKKVAPIILVFVILCIFLFSIGFLALTNPSEAMHTRTIISYEGKITGQQFGGYEGGIAGQLFGQLLGSLANTLGVTPFEYHNFVIFSTMTSGDQLISFGILQNVKIVAPDSFFMVGNPTIPNLRGTEIPNNINPASPTSSINNLSIEGNDLKVWVGEDINEEDYYLLIPLNWIKKVMKRHDEES